MRATDSSPLLRGSCDRDSVVDEELALDEELGIRRAVDRLERAGVPGGGILPAPGTSGQDCGGRG